jgi:cell fate regulator YaaT (PSP1 superfamily)
MYASNWLDGISDGSDYDTVEVTFKNTRNGFYSNPDHLELHIGDIVAVEGNPGHDIGRVSMVGKLVKLQMRKHGVKDDAVLKSVFRHATQADIEKFEEARSREHSTMIKSRKIAEDLELNMKIGDVEYQGDGAKAIFYYIADERVDFRKLIRILADTFKIRVEMKQIGARQEAGRIGGIGPCGRPLCCSSWMTHFVSVGTGAARVQDLSMNPQKLAGQCAKLKCCLNFETDTYAEAIKKLPGKDVVLQTLDTDYFLFKQDILAGTLTYSTDKRIPANLVTITSQRAFEIIELNRKGEKVDNLLPEEEVKEAEKPKTLDLAEQESITRFDKSKRKKKKKNAENKDRQPKQQQPKQQPKQQQPQKQQPKLQQGRHNGQQPHPRNRQGNQRRKGSVSATDKPQKENS